MNTNKVILIVEDNESVLRLNKKVLESKGFFVEKAKTIAEARNILCLKLIDLIVLDILLPDGSGLDFCTEIRELTIAPILILSSLRSQADIVTGLITGADDYMTKPYNVNELLARITAMLRRQGIFERKQEKDEEKTIVCGPLTLDMVSARAYLNKKDIGLTPKEFALLLVFVQNNGQILPSQMLYDKIWGNIYNKDTRLLWTHISNLRSKLKIDGNELLSIIAVRGKGYQLKYQDVLK